MFFTNIKTESDIEKLKKRIVKDDVVASRLAGLRQRINYTKSGKSRLDESQAPAGKIEMPTNAEMLALYKDMVASGEEKPNPVVERSLRKIKTKSNSGVAVVSLLTKPFPCPGRCTYCPTEYNMPKSYLAKEPAAARALANDFDPYAQVVNRLKALVMNGHPIDKVEVIVIGGTWSFYHHAYQEEVIRDIFRACNEFSDLPIEDEQKTKEAIARLKERKTTLGAEQEKNETASSRVVGLSIETRPDFIDTKELLRLRELGVTKVEIGVQHLDDEVLDLTKRDMKIAQVAQAAELLRDAGFKVVYHMMPNLPGSTPERDSAMFGELFSGLDHHPDMLKIYPCMVLENSELYHIWKKGGYKVYSDDELIRVLREAKKQIPPYVRILRVIRDVPATYIKAGSTISNLRQTMEADMKKNDWRCRCIRCKEVRESIVDPEDFLQGELAYETRRGKEVFLSWENKDKTKLASFLRLRLPVSGGADAPLDVLKRAALVRELHTYGRQTPVESKGEQSQHIGLGKRLLKRAEDMAREAGYEKIAVISGVGVREYYKKQGYRLAGTYMVKYLDSV